MKRRINRSWSAAIIACVGMFFVSAGVGLTATAASATQGPDHKVAVCHKAGNSGNYKWISPDKAATNGGHEGHVGDVFGITEEACAAMSTGPTSTKVGVTFTDPRCDNQGLTSYLASGDHVTWAMTGTKAPGGTVTVTATPDEGYVISGTDSFTHTYPAFDADSCGEVESPVPTEVGVTFTDPTCDNEGVASYSTAGDHVTWATTGTKAPGGTVTVTATPDEGYVISGTKSFTHTFAGLPDCGDVVLPPTDEPPVVDPPVVKPPVVKQPVVLAPAPAPVKADKGKSQSPAKGAGNATVIPTLVKAGLPGSPAGTASPTTPLGMVFTGVGLMLLVMAGGVVIVGRRHDGA